MYGIAVIVQLLLSSYYHVARCCFCSDENAFNYWFQLDLFGIWLVNTFAIPASSYILFECHPQYEVIGYGWGNLYLFVFVSYSFFLVVPLWFIHPDTSFETKLVAIVVWIIGMCGETFHALYVFNADEYAKFCHGPVLHCIFFLSAFTFFTSRIPERCKPGQFDIYGSSHQIFHILIAIAAIHWWYYLHCVSQYMDYCY